LTHFPRRRKEVRLSIGERNLSIGREGTDAGGGRKQGPGVGEGEGRKKKSPIQVNAEVAAEEKNGMALIRFK